jgi:SAM-dependent methyltransferase
MQCHICGHAQGKTFNVQEMMFGTREVFGYWECADCGCLQLMNPPTDMARHYPSGKYCSFQTQPVGGVPERGRFRSWLWKKRNAALCFGESGLFEWLGRWKPNPVASAYRDWFQQARIQSFDARIVDLGSGSGAILNEFARLGFTSLLGVDPFLPADQTHGPVRLIRQPITSLAGDSFDWVMLHHSLEHMPDQHEVFELLPSLIRPNGCCLIRIPLASEGPWQRYGTDWAELDAPRHFFLHTERSLKLIAAQHGMQVHHVEYEAEPFAYAVSEMYRQGKPLFDEASGRHHDWRRLFSETECSAFEQLAVADQRQNRAGRAAFHLSIAPGAI